MVRNILLLMTILILTLGAILYGQWNNYSKHKIEMKKEIPVKAYEDITIQTVMNGNLKITQTFRSLKKNVEYRINEPRKILNWVCTKKDGKICDSRDKDPHTFLPDKGEIVIDSTLEGKKNHPVFQLSEWRAVLPQIRIARTNLKIVDSVDRGGTWVAGIPLIGYKRMDLIDYYVFEGKKDDFSLYWQKKPLYATRRNSFFTYYSENPSDKWTIPANFSAQLENSPFLAIIHTSKLPSAKLSGLLIENGRISSSEVETALIENNIKQKIEIVQGDNHWLVELLASLYLEKPMHSGKALSVYAELKTKYTDSELKEFVESIIRSNHKMNFVDLDRLLGEMHGLGTHFFSSLQHQPHEQLRLSFFDLRKVLLNGKENSKIEIMVLASEKFFPFLVTMKELGYQVSITSSEKKIVLNKDNNQYEFADGRTIFLKNGQQYGMLKSPFIVKNNVIFISQIGLQSIFNVKIQESEKEIQILNY
ncbi:MAG: stalk domain-containing protein [Bacillota bacterium]|nr:stalk domain-containing protein [Bacillota bacterium]